MYRPTKRLHELARPKSQIYSWASGSRHAGPSKSMNNLTRIKSRTSPMTGSKSQGAMPSRPESSKRINELARPKPKRSEIRIMSVSKSQPAMYDGPSKRLTELASPKSQHSEIWTVPVCKSLGAMSSGPSKRVTDLAQHKPLSPQYLDKHREHHVYGCGRSSTIWEMSPYALTCPTRPRSAILARPKPYHPDYMPSKSVRR